MASVLFFGCGAMGEAILSSLLRCGEFRKDDITVLDRRQDRLKELNVSYGVSVADAAGKIDSVGKFDILVLAVKPQDLSAAIDSLKKIDFKLLVTILAGVKCSAFEEALAGKPVLRVMPNLALRAGKSVNALFAGPNYIKSPMKGTFDTWANSIFASCGDIVRLKSEDEIDRITAVTGSGPAYVCYLMEALTEAAQSLGFARDEARRMVFLTFEGTLEYLKQAGEAPAELRKKVTSKGGTTEAAVADFGKNNLKKIIEDGVRAAYDRAVEMGNKTSGAKARNSGE